MKKQVYVTKVAHTNQGDYLTNEVFVASEYEKAMEVFEEQVRKLHKKYFDGPDANISNDMFDNNAEYDEDSSHVNWEVFGKDNDWAAAYEVANGYCEDEYQAMCYVTKQEIL